MADFSYAGELQFARDIAREAGKIMRENFMAGMSREWKADGTPLTATDTSINTLVIERLKTAYPEHSVLGEEESHNLGRSYTWVCDPVDGTMPFSHGVPISTFSLALVDNGSPVVGVVFDPFIARMFWAVKGQGAYLNGAAIRVSKQRIQNALIDVEGFPSTHPVIAADASLNTALYKSGARVTSLWSAILPAALIAAGEYTAVIFNVAKPEDGAAIKVIVEEAGGRVTDLFGQEQRYDGPTQGFIASNGVVHQQILDIVSQYPRA